MKKIFSSLIILILLPSFTLVFFVGCGKSALESAIEYYSAKLAELDVGYEINVKYLYPYDVNYRIVFLCEDNTTFQYKCIYEPDTSFEYTERIGYYEKTDAGIYHISYSGENLRGELIMGYDGVPSHFEYSILSDLYFFKSIKKVDFTKVLANIASHEMDVNEGVYVLPEQPIEPYDSSLHPKSFYPLASLSIKVENKKIVEMNGLARSYNRIPYRVTEEYEFDIKVIYSPTVDLPDYIIY